MPEIIKYLSPVAFLTIVWAVVQFYQKRKDERRDKKRDAKLIVYNAIYKSIKEIEFEMFKFISNSRIPMLNVKEEVASFNDLLENLSEKNEILKKEIKAIKKNKNNINVEFNEFESDWKANKKMLDDIILKKEQALNKNVDEISPIFDSLISTLESKIEEINKISLLILPEKEKLEKRIFELSHKISTTIETCKTNKHIDENGIPNLNLIELFRNLFEITDSIKSDIYKKSN